MPCMCKNGEEDSMAEAQRRGRGRWGQRRVRSGLRKTIITTSTHSTIGPRVDFELWLLLEKNRPLGTKVKMGKWRGTIEVDDGDFDKVDGGQGGEKWPKSGFILKVELTEFADSNILGLELDVKSWAGLWIVSSGERGVQFHVGWQHYVGKVLGHCMSRKQNACCYGAAKRWNGVGSYWFSLLISHSLFLGYQILLFRNCFQLLAPRVSTRSRNGQCTVCSGHSVCLGKGMWYDLGQ